MYNNEKNDFPFRHYVGEEREQDGSRARRYLDERTLPGGCVQRGRHYSFTTED